MIYRSNLNISLDIYHFGRMLQATTASRSATLASCSDLSIAGLLHLSSHNWYHPVPPCTSTCRPTLGLLMHTQCTQVSGSSISPYCNRRWARLTEHNILLTKDIIVFMHRFDISVRLGESIYLISNSIVCANHLY